MGTSSHVWLIVLLYGIKKYEYRKKVFKKNVEKVYIYSTSPDKCIVGFFLYKGYLQGDKDIIWELTHKEAGISKEAYDEYFKHSTIAYAIKIEEFYTFDISINPREYFDSFTAPQSYMYLEGDVVI